MTSKLGVYWSVEHRRQADYDYFKALQPSVFKIMDGGPPDYAFARDNLLGALVIARDWALSEQHQDMLTNPVGTGQRHAQEWNEHQPKLGFDRAKTLILGINEPHVWEPGVPEALRQYTIVLCSEAKKFGLRVGAMQLGVGWPGNNGPDTPPDWSPFHGVEQAIIDNGGALICHEYWADKGPSENWGWWAGRTLKCPWQVPIIIGEAGVDMFVKDTSGGQQNRGWVGHMPPERYAAELWEYTSRMSADPRFVGSCPFASDFQSKVDWFSFDVMPAYQAILAAKIPDTPPVIIRLPEIHGPTPTGPTPTGPTATPNTPAGARIRSGPGLVFPILGNVPKGQPMAVTGVNNSAGMAWYRVDSPHGVGWVASTVVSLSNMGGVPEVSAPQPTPEPGSPQGAPTPTPTSGGIIDPRVAQAILNVESGGQSFGPDNRPLIRFEAHIFKQQFQNDERFNQFFRFNPDKPWTGQERRITINHPWKPIHTGNQQDENDAFAEAQMMDTEAAHKSISMGAAQIMGFNHARIGYPTAQAMYQAFKSAPLQTIAFINYFLSDPALAQAMRDKNWEGIARGYNGSGNIAEASAKYRAAYQALGAA